MFPIIYQIFYPNGISTHSPTHNFFIINFFTFTTHHKHLWASLVLRRHHRFLSISCNARPIPLVCYFLLDVTDDKATDTLMQWRTSPTCNMITVILMKITFTFPLFPLTGAIPYKHYTSYLPHPLSIFPL